ncbi:MAG: signal peptidase I [Chloroflexi bacterium]|nr:MAG: signal peptidase I [Chloroflexota bacterium]
MSTRVRSHLSLAALALVLVAWAVLLRPASLGGPVTYIIVRGSSMQPTYAAGDLIIVRQTSEYRVGEVVAYRVPGGEIGAGHIVIHRIVGGDDNGFTLRGDNNPSLDPWNPHASDIVGEAWVAAPGLGRILAALHQPLLLAAFAAAVMVAMVMAWKRSPRAPPSIGSRRRPAHARSSRGPRGPAQVDS